MKSYSLIHSPIIQNPQASSRFGLDPEVRRRAPTKASAVPILKKTQIQFSNFSAKLDSLIGQSRNQPLISCSQMSSPQGRFLPSIGRDCQVRTSLLSPKLDPVRLDPGAGHKSKRIHNKYNIQSHLQNGGMLQNGKTLKATNLRNSFRIQPQTHPSLPSDLQASTELTSSMMLTTEATSTKYVTEDYLSMSHSGAELAAQPQNLKWILHSKQGGANMTSPIQIQNPEDPSNRRILSLNNSPLGDPIQVRSDNKHGSLLQTTHRRLKKIPKLQALNVDLDVLSSSLESESLFSQREEAAYAVQTNWQIDEMPKSAFKVTGNKRKHEMNLNLQNARQLLKTKRNLPDYKIVRGSWAPRDNQRKGKLVNLSLQVDRLHEERELQSKIRLTQRYKRQYGISISKQYLEKDQEQIHALLQRRAQPVIFRRAAVQIQKWFRATRARYSLSEGLKRLIKAIIMIKRATKHWAIKRQIKNDQLQEQQKAAFLVQNCLRGFISREATLKVRSLAQLTKMHDRYMKIDRIMRGHLQRLLRRAWLGYKQRKDQQSIESLKLATRSASEMTPIKMRKVTGEYNYRKQRTIGQRRWCPSPIESSLESSNSIAAEMN